MMYGQGVGKDLSEVFVIRVNMENTLTNDFFSFYSVNIKLVPSMTSLYIEVLVLQIVYFFIFMYVYV